MQIDRKLGQNAHFYTGAAISRRRPPPRKPRKPWLFSRARAHARARRQNSPCLVIPFGAFDFGQSLPLDQISEHPERFAPIKGTARHRQVTFDGFLTASTAGGLSEPQRAYVQVFRTGVVEAVTSSIVRGKENNFIVLPFLQSRIIEYARGYASSLQSCGAEPPLQLWRV